MNDLIKCRCGVVPEMKTGTKIMGHGFFITAYWVECACGLKTLKSAAFNKSGAQCKEEVIKIWNGN